MYLCWFGKSLYFEIISNFPHVTESLGNKKTGSVMMHTHPCLSCGSNYLPHSFLCLNFEMEIPTKSLESDRVDLRT